MDGVADSEIDAKGRFKYILIQVVDKKSGADKLIVRGFGHCGFHGIDPSALYQSNMVNLYLVPNGV